jgi:hypothetical protein
MDNGFVLAVDAQEFIPDTPLSYPDHVCHSKKRVVEDMVANAHLVDVVIFHKNCLDGLLAAWCIWRHTHGDSHRCRHRCVFYPEVPGQTRLGKGINVDGKRVVMVDVSYDSQTMDCINTRASSFLLLDHHKSNLDKIGDRPYALFDMDRSAASMAWLTFFPRDPLPLMVRYIEAHDLGVRDDENVRAFAAAMGQHMLPHDLKRQFPELENLLGDHETQKMVSEGAVVDSTRGKLIERNMHIGYECAFWNPDTQEYMRCVVANFGVASLTGDMAHALAVKHKDTCYFSALWVYQNDKKHYSIVFRSVHDHVDVSQIADYYQRGGGHPGASHMYYSGDIHSLFKPIK